METLPVPAITCVHVGSRLRSPHLGMRSCERDASLVRALMSAVMTRGAGRVVPSGGLDEVISNSTASSASKQEVMSLTEQRESQDTDRYSPSTHTCGREKKHE